MNAFRDYINSYINFDEPPALAPPPPARIPHADLACQQCQEAARRGAAHWVAAPMEDDGGPMFVVTVRS